MGCVQLLVDVKEYEGKAVVRIDEFGFIVSEGREGGEEQGSSHGWVVGKQRKGPQNRKRPGQYIVYKDTHPSDLLLTQVSLPTSPCGILLEVTPLQKILEHLIVVEVPSQVQPEGFFTDHLRVSQSSLMDSQD